MYRILGVALLALGVLLLAMGVTSSESFGSRVSTYFSGRPTARSTRLMLGGGVSVVLGACALIAARSRPKQA